MESKALWSKSEPLLATGAVLGAVAASSCCVLPLLFVSAGVSGAWIGTLTSLAPYQPIFLALSVACIAAGFWSVYGRRETACTGTECGSAAIKAALWSGVAIKAALWAGAAIVMVAASAEWWARLLS
jgi:mercuric ion transport protein